MRTPRSWKRESRLLLVIDELSDEQRGAEAGDVIALDFLLQHPSLFGDFARGKTPRWPGAALATTVETESSEESLLRWKRSVGGIVLVPMLGRQISRGLIRRSTRGQLLITARGRITTRELRGRLGENERARIPLLANQLKENLPASRNWLFEALTERAS